MWWWGPDRPGVWREGGEEKEGGGRGQREREGSEGVRGKEETERGRKGGRVSEREGG